MFGSICLFHSFHHQTVFFNEGEKNHVPLDAFTTIGQRVHDMNASLLSLNFHFKSNR